MRLILFPLFSTLLSVSATYSLAAAERESTPTAGLAEELHNLVRAKHAKATLKQSGRNFTIAVKTRTFPIMRTDKRGRWQEPRETIGPDRGGIIIKGYIDERKTWNGALVVRKGHPTRLNTDLHVFQERTIIWPSAKKKSYLWMQIITRVSLTTLSLRAKSNQQPLATTRTGPTK